MKYDRFCESCDKIFKTIRYRNTMCFKCRCVHKKCSPVFDMDKARLMSTSQIRSVYPRFYGECPDCGASVIAYASFAHYLMGGW